MDVVVTLSKKFGLKNWIAEGDAAGDPPAPGYPFYYWKVPSRPKKLKNGERVYVVYDGALIGYAPLFAITNHFGPNKGIYLVRRGGAVAVTIDEYIRGFQGYRYRWWDRSQERPFPTWKEELL